MSEENKNEQEMTNEGARTVSSAELGQHIGKYIKLWKDETKVVGKIVKVEMDVKKITYDLVSGFDKGKRIRSSFSDQQTVDVYDDESLVLALLDT